MSERYPGSRLDIASDGALGAFFDLALAQVDNASDIAGNHGDLILPSSAENLNACSWGTAGLKMPLSINTLYPYDRHDRVTIHASYLYGRDVARMSITILKPSDTSSVFKIGARLKPNGSIDQALLVNRQGGQVEQYNVGEGLCHEVVNVIFGQSTNFNPPSSLPISDVFRLGIAIQEDAGADVESTELAFKQAIIHAPMNDGTTLPKRLNLEVEINNRTHPNGKHCVVETRLSRQFLPSDYTHGQQGNLNQYLTIARDRGGQIVEALRHSTIKLTSDVVDIIPFADTDFYEPSKADLPPSLASLLYKDPTPTIADLRLFDRLLTSQLVVEDADIGR